MTLRWRLRSYLLIINTLSFIAGITISFYYEFPPLPLLTALALTSCYFLLSICHNRNSTLLALLVVFFLSGLFNGQIAQNPKFSSDHLVNLLQKDQEAVVIGTVQQILGFNGKTSKCDISVSSIRYPGHDFRKAHGVIRYSLEGVFAPEILPGQSVAVRSRLQRPPRTGTPGSFDYPRYLALKNIYVTGFIPSVLYIQPVQRPNSFWQRVIHFPEFLRVQINNLIDKRLSGDLAGVYKALLTGNRSTISSTTIQHFREAGCFHVLAISGLHMSLLGILLYALFFFFLCRSARLIHRINTKKVAAALSVFPLLLYTLIAGASTPVLRSFIMSLVVIFAICYGKKPSFYTLLSFAALFVLILSPASLATASFQLTFAAVIAIAAAAPYLTGLNILAKARINSKYLSGPATWVGSALVVSLAATAGTAPLLIYHFNQISLVGVLANLVIEPLICLWSLPLGFFATLFFTVHEPLAGMLLTLGGYGISLAISAVNFFSSLPGSAVILPTPSLFLILGYYLALILLLAPPKNALKVKPAVLALLGIIVFFIAVPPEAITRHFGRESRLSFLDVGHGSCTVVEAPGGKIFLIDGGTLASQDFDMGKRLIAPFLLRQGIRKIHGIVVTHPDSDHYNGIVYILKHFGVETLWVSTRRSKTEGWRRLLDTAKEEGINIVVGRAQEMIAANDLFSLQVLANTTTEVHSAPTNNSGLVLEYRQGNFSVLFPGDIPAEQEQKLVRMHTDLQATVLLAVHHGSATSNSREFLQQVQPEVMIASAGRNRRFDFPSLEIAKRCRQLNIPLLSTNRNGTITLETEKGRYKLLTYYPLNGVAESAFSPPIKHR